MNLLTETLEKMNHHGLTEDDVLYVNVPLEYFSDETGKFVTENHYITFEQFKSIANVTYDSGYGSAEVNVNTIIVFKNGVMHRHEYDGAEWWEYIELPQNVPFDMTTDKVKLWYEL